LTAPPVHSSGASILAFSIGLGENSARRRDDTGM